MKELLTVGDAAVMLGCSNEGVRKMEDRGVLKPWARTTGGIRLYDAADVEQLKGVRDARPTKWHPIGSTASGEQATLTPFPMSTGRSPDGQVELIGPAPNWAPRSDWVHAKRALPYAKSRRIDRHVTHRVRSVSFSRRRPGLVLVGFWCLTDPSRLSNVLLTDTPLDGTDICERCATAFARGGTTGRRKLMRIGAAS